MKFSCDRCHKKFSTSDEPVPGRVYRIPCKCGNTIVLQLDAAVEQVELPRSSAPVREPPRRAAPPPIPAPAPPAAPEPARVPTVAADWAAVAAQLADDPFVRARAESPDLRVLLACASEDVTPTVLARRDPDAPPELSSVYDPEPALDPFADELRRTRTHALALGSTAGAAVGAVCAAVITVLLLRPWSVTVASPSAPEPDVRVAQAAPRLGPERPVAGRRHAVARASVPAVAEAPRARAVPALAPAPAPAAQATPDAGTADTVLPARAANVPAPDASAPAAAPERLEAAAADGATEPDRAATRTVVEARAPERSADAVAETPRPADEPPQASVVAAGPATEPLAVDTSGDTPPTAPDP